MCRFFLHSKSQNVYKKKKNFNFHSTANDWQVNTQTERSSTMALQTPLLYIDPHIPLISSTNEEKTKRPQTKHRQTKPISLLRRSFSNDASARIPYQPEPVFAPVTTTKRVDLYFRWCVGNVLHDTTKAHRRLMWRKNGKSIAADHITHSLVVLFLCDLFHLIE